jgi:hypothetical protein
MKFITILLPLLWVQSLISLAQSVPVEAMVGHENYWYQHSVFRQFSSKSKFGFFHVSSLHVFYDEHKIDEIMSQSYVTYRLTSGVNLALGSFYATGPGFSPAVAVQLMKKTRDLLILVVPRTDLQKKATYEVMAMAEYRPMFTEKVGMYVRAQLMSNYGTHHNRSYQNFRLGVSVNKVQFGLAMNLDEYGKETQTRHNLGLFIRTEL